MKFYDHAKNAARPAVGSAMARARRDAVKDGTDLRVEATPRPHDNGPRFFWNGCRYDARVLAKELDWNGFVNVTLTNRAGEPVAFGGKL